MSDSFEIGQRLEWLHRDGGTDRALVTRYVIYRGQSDSQNAIIEFGRDQLTAPLGELSRITPPVLAHPVVPIPPPDIVDPPSLGQHRQALKHALDQHRSAMEA